MHRVARLSAPLLSEPLSVGLSCYRVRSNDPDKGVHMHMGIGFPHLILGAFVAFLS